MLKPLILLFFIILHKFYFQNYLGLICYLAPVRSSFTYQPYDFALAVGNDMLPHLLYHIPLAVGKIIAYQFTSFHTERVEPVTLFA